MAPTWYGSRVQAFSRWQVREPYALWAAPWIFVAMALSGCSSDDPTCASFDYTGYAPAQDPSFKSDVQPILATSCAQLSCHGSFGEFTANEPRERPLDLGPPV